MEGLRRWSIWYQRGLRGVFRDRGTTRGVKESPMGALVVIKVGLLFGRALGVLGPFARWPHPHWPSASGQWPHPRWPPSQQWPQSRWPPGLWPQLHWPQAIGLKMFRKISGSVRIVIIKLA